MIESPAATILRHLREQPGTVLDLLDRINDDPTLPDVGEPGWCLFTTHTVYDALEAVAALGELVGREFLRRDEHGVLSLDLGAPNDDTAELVEAVRAFLGNEQGPGRLRLWHMDVPNFHGERDQYEALVGAMYRAAGLFLPEWLSGGRS